MRLPRPAADPLPAALDGHSAAEQPPRAVGLALVHPARRAQLGGFDHAANVGHDEGQMDRSAVSQARTLLESLMVRRVKSEVETTLRPKIEYVLKPPLSPLQRAWYRKLLQKATDEGEPAAGGSGGGGASSGSGLLTVAQLQSRLMQLQKVCTTPRPSR